MSKEFVVGDLVKRVTEYLPGAVWRVIKIDYERGYYLEEIHNDLIEVIAKRENISPISLTEKLLFQSSFKKEDSNTTDYSLYQSEKFPFSIRYYNFPIEQRWSICVNGVDLLFMKYLHELRRFVFGIGCEL